MNYLLLSIIIISLVGILMVPNAFAEVSTMVTLDLQSSILEKDWELGPDGMFEGKINSAILTISGQLRSTDHYITGAPIKLVFIVLPDDHLWFNEKDHYEVITDDEGKFNERIFVRNGVMSLVENTNSWSPRYIPDEYLHRLDSWKNFWKGEMSVRAVFDGGGVQNSLLSGGAILEPSKSQIEFFSITASQNIVHEVTTSSSQSSASRVGGPTFLKLEIETDKTVVTISGKLTDRVAKSFVVRDKVITLIPSGFLFPKDTSACISYYLPNCILKTSDRGEFAVRFTLPVGEDYSVQAVFDGNNQWDPSKSLIQFAVTSQSSTSSEPPPSSPSQPSTSTASGDFEWAWFLVLLAVVFAVAAGVLAKKGLKKKHGVEDDEYEYDQKQREAKDDEDQYDREQSEDDEDEREREQREQEYIQRERARKERIRREQAQREQEKTRKRRQKGEITEEDLKGTYYDLLGVSKGASQKEIKMAYRKLINKYHPDKNPKDEFALKISKKLTVAYNVLSNQVKRKNYDENLNRYFV